MSDEELQQMDKEQLLGIIKAQRFEISILKDDKEHLGEFLKEKDEEIERLNNLLKETSQTLSEQTTKAITLKSENERLNNIINKLEQWLVERIDEYKEMELYDNASAYDYTLYTLQELKGSDKE